MLVESANDNATIFFLMLQVRKFHDLNFAWQSKIQKTKDVFAMFLRFYQKID